MLFVECRTSLPSGPGLFEKGNAHMKNIIKASLRSFIALSFVSVFAVVIATPQTRVRIASAGVYRINVSASGVTEVAVQKGRAFIGEGAAATRVKGGQVARVGAGGLEVAKLDKKGRDTLDQWSHD